MEQRYLPQSYGLKMLNAALAIQTNQTEEANQTYKKRSRFDPFNIDPEDPFDVSASKSTPHNEDNQPHNKRSRFYPFDNEPDDTLKPTDQDWTDCGDGDTDYIPESLGSDSDSQEVPIQSTYQTLSNIIDIEKSATNNYNYTPQEATVSTYIAQEIPSKKPKRPCIYCGVFHAQLVRHLKRKHQSEEAVVAALKLPKAEQDRAFSEIRKLGIYEYNVMHRNNTSNSPLIKERRQGTGNILMCSGCKGFFDSRAIWKHKKKCFSDNQLHSVNFSSLSKEASGLDLPEDFKTQVVNAFRKDPVGNLCRNDKVVLIMGKKWWAKSERKDKHSIMAEMRLYANIIMEMRRCSQQDITGEDVVNREYFEFLNKAIVNLTSKECGDSSMKSGLKVRIGFLLKKAINILKGHYILTRNEDKEKEVGRFDAVLQLNWDYIFYSAQLRCELRRNDLRKPKSMPDEEDLKTLRNREVDRSLQSMGQTRLHLDEEPCSQSIDYVHCKERRRTCTTHFKRMGRSGEELMG